MILHYSASIAGPYHLKKGLPCQDDCEVKEGRDGFWVAANADGLGSEKHSDIGARIAVLTATAECARNITRDMTDEEIFAAMEAAYARAYEVTKLVAEKADGDVEEYDTTLCLAVYDGKTLYWGQSGDSGMVAMLKDGSYLQVTEQQRDEDGCVFPLCCGAKHWKFGKVEGEVAAVMLMTDGVWDQMVPRLLADQPVAVNVPLAEKFMAHHEKAAEEVKELEKAAMEYLKHYPEKLLDDDKTITVLWNSEITPARQPEEYYQEPDWHALQEAYLRRRKEKNMEQEEEMMEEAEELEEEQKEPEQTEETQQKKETTLSRPVQLTLWLMAALYAAEKVTLLLYLLPKL